MTSCDAVLPACEDEPRWRGSPRGSRRGERPSVRPRRLPRHGVQAGFARAVRRARRPAAAQWPDCGFPVVVKPSTASGSEGVAIARDEAELVAARGELERAGHEVVVEEYVAGPSLSLEVLALGGRAVPLQVTGLEFDAVYDCRRVVRPWARGRAAGGHRPRWPPAPGTPRCPAGARRLRRRLRAPRTRPRPQRSHGHRGHGARRRAQVLESTPACPARRRPPSTGQRAQHRRVALPDSA